MKVLFQPDKTAYLTYDKLLTSEKMQHTSESIKARIKGHLQTTLGRTQMVWSKEQEPLILKTLEFLTVRQSGFDTEMDLEALDVFISKAVKEYFSKGFDVHTG